MTEEVRQAEATEREETGPRAILRVPEVLMAVAAQKDGATLAELALRLSLPKTSLHRLLKTLEQGGFLVREAGRFRPGGESFRLASLIAQAAPSEAFPANARPVLEWLARETGETVMLSVLSERRSETVYVDVIESESQLRFSMRVGNRRPLFSAASGKAMLAFRDLADQQAYLDQTEFLEFTADTTRKEEMPAVMAKARASGVVFDRNGIVDGASGIASPGLDADGQVVCAVSAAGPTERMEARRAGLEALVLDAGEKISRILGYRGAYPPAP